MFHRNCMGEVVSGDCLRCGKTVTPNDVGLRVIIATSRSMRRYRAVYRAVSESGFRIAEVVSGSSRSIYGLGKKWAKANGVGVKRFLYGHSTLCMADYADALVAVWGVYSKGMRAVIQEACEKGLPVHIHRV
jgi:hypothetical protein